MAEIEVGSQLTLVELAKRSVNSKIVTDIAETISKIIQVMEDAVHIECNQVDHHIFTQRLSYPAGSWRQLNSGVAGEASVTKQVTEGTGMLEAFSTIDEALVELSGNSAAFRHTEDMAFLEGLTQTFGTALVYGNIGVNPEQIQGWATRYATAGTLVKSASGTGSDTSSVWIVQWGQTKCHMLYPQGSSVGLDAEDLGVETVLDSDNSYPYRAYRTHFKWKPGFAVHDDRCIGRVANIEDDGAANLFNPDLLIQIINNMIERAAGAVIYVNPTIQSQMDVAAMDKANVYYSVKDLFGVPTTHFRGIPIKQFDSITVTETAI